MDPISAFNNAITIAFGPTMLVFALAAIGLNVQFGYGGMLNFGQAAFAACGAYGLAMTVTVFAPSWFGALGPQLTFWLGIVVGIAGAILLALLLGIPTLRLRADYLAIATIAAAEILRRSLRSSTLREWTGGTDGLRGFAEVFREYGFVFGFTRDARYEFGPFFYTGVQMWVIVVGWIIVAATLLVVWLLMRSPWGRVLKSIREDEDAARSLGKNVFSYKMQALVIGGVIGAFAGFLDALAQGNALPDNYTPQFTFFLYAMVILGGAARIFGPLLGAMIFWFLFNLISTLLRQLAVTGVLPPGLMDTTQVGPVVFFMLGAGIIAMLIFRPQGILGDRRELSFDVR